MKPSFRQLALLAAFASAPVSLFADTAPAYTALMQGRVEDATVLLRRSVASNASDGYAHQLLCRAAYAQEQIDSAVHECELATAAAPSDSDTQMWLGRALGQKASHANPLAAFALARRVRVAFERAVQLDPGNGAAASDLGEFYIAAPSIVGGGDNKAMQLAASMSVRSPARSHRLLGLLADKSKDVPRAEAEFKAAVAAGHTPEAWVDLGFFYHRHNRPDQALAAIQQALGADLRHGPASVDAASTLAAANLAPALAEQAFRNYLSSPNQSDSAPAFKVRMQLGKLLLARGDRMAAREQLTAAVALAPRYEPAKKALAAL